MDRRRAAGALLTLAACIACVTSAPTASNQTALDLYETDGSEGCYYNFQHYGEGDRIMTNEPCLNCTCHNRMLMCYLRVCPFTKPIGQDCTVEKRADQCCPIVTCPDVPVDLLTSTSTTSPAEYGTTGVGRHDKYGCSIDGKYFSEGSKVPQSPNKPCEHCYCIRNMTTCVMQECTLHVDGCTPIYLKDVCCPVRYSCDHPEDEIPLLDDMTTTVRPTPGFLLTTTTMPSVTQVPQDCVHDDQIFADGALIKTEKACEHCYCMKGDIVCVVQECGTPMENEGKNCTSMAPREGQCCPDTYICEGDNEVPLEEATTVPPRRTIEGSGYRNEPGEQYTESPTFAPELEGSGMEGLFSTEESITKKSDESDAEKPLDGVEKTTPVSEDTNVTDDILKETTDKSDSKDEDLIPRIDKTTVADDVFLSTTSSYKPDSEKSSTSSAEAPITTTEPDKGENTVPVERIEDKTTTQVTYTTSHKFGEEEILYQTTEFVQKQENDMYEGTTKLPETYSSISSDTSKTTSSSKEDDTTHVPTTTPLADINDQTSPDTTSSPEIYTKSHDDSQSIEYATDKTTMQTQKQETTSPEGFTTEKTELDRSKPTDAITQDITTLIPHEEEESKTELPKEITTLQDHHELTTKVPDEPEATTAFNTPSYEVDTETPLSSVESKSTTVNLVDDIYQTTKTIEPKVTTTKSHEEVTTVSTVEHQTSDQQDQTTTKELIETTSINPMENEIHEDGIPTVSPGVIPGEGNCLVNGVTYTNDSEVPSTIKCETNCKCVSSIVRCDPIICSEPPQNIIKCQPVYDTPDTCCPTYMCDHDKESLPPKPHSQMSGTDSPPHEKECNTEGCDKSDEKTSTHSPPSIQENECTSNECLDQKPLNPDFSEPMAPENPQVCLDGKCLSPPETCEGVDCQSHPQIIPCNKDSGCENVPSTDCTGSDCIDKTTIQEPVRCDNENGCLQSEVPPHVCDGEACKGSPIQPSETDIKKDTDTCKDNNSCNIPETDKTPEVECSDDECTNKAADDLQSKFGSKCTDSECISKLPLPHVDDIITQKPSSDETPVSEEATETKDKEDESSASASTTEISPPITKTSEEALSESPQDTTELTTKASSLPEDDPNRHTDVKDTDNTLDTDLSETTTASKHDEFTPVTNVPIVTVSEDSNIHAEISTEHPMITEQPSQEQEKISTIAEQQATETPMMQQTQSQPSDIPVTEVHLPKYTTESSNSMEPEQIITEFDQNLATVTLKPIIDTGLTSEPQPTQSESHVIKDFTTTEPEIHSQDDSQVPVEKQDKETITSTQTPSDVLNVSVTDKYPETPTVYDDQKQETSPLPASVTETAVSPDITSVSQKETELESVTTETEPSRTEHPITEDTETKSEQHTLMPLDITTVLSSEPADASTILPDVDHKSEPPHAIETTSQSQLSTDNLLETRPTPDTVSEISMSDVTSPKIDDNTAPDGDDITLWTHRIDLPTTKYDKSTTTSKTFVDTTPKEKEGEITETPEVKVEEAETTRKPDEIELMTDKPATNMNEVRTTSELPLLSTEKVEIDSHSHETLPDTEQSATETSNITENIPTTEHQVKLHEETTTTHIGSDKETDPFDFKPTDISPNVASSESTTLESITESSDDALKSSSTDLITDDRTTESPSTANENKEDTTTSHELSSTTVSPTTKSQTSIQEEEKLTTISSVPVFIDEEYPTEKVTIQPESTSKQSEPELYDTKLPEYHTELPTAPESTVSVFESQTTTIPELSIDDDNKDATHAKDRTSTAIPEIQTSNVAAIEESIDSTPHPDTRKQFESSAVTTDGSQEIASVTEQVSKKDDKPTELTGETMPVTDYVTEPIATTIKYTDDSTILSKPEAITTIAPDASSDIPKVPASEPKKEITKSPDLPKEESTDLPEKDTDTSSDIPKVPDTEAVQETTESPDLPKEKSTELPEKDTDITKMPDTEIEKETTESPDLPKDESTTVPERDAEISSDMPKIPDTEAVKETTEYPDLPNEKSTELPEKDTDITNMPETEIEKETTESPDLPKEESTTLPENDTDSSSDIPKMPDTEVVKETTESPDLPKAESTELPEKDTDISSDITKMPDIETGIETTKSPDLPTGEPTELPEKDTDSSSDNLKTPEAETKKETTESPDLPKEESTKVPEKDIASDGLVTVSPAIETDYETESLAGIQEVTTPSILESEKTEELVTKQSPVYDKSSPSINEELVPTTVSTPQQDTFVQVVEQTELETEVPVKEVTTSKPENIEPIEHEISTEHHVPTETYSETTIQPDTPQDIITEKSESTTDKSVETISHTAETEKASTTKSPELLSTEEPKDEYSETTPYLVELEEHTHRMDYGGSTSYPSDLTTHTIEDILEQTSSYKPDDTVIDITAKPIIASDEKDTLEPVTSSLDNKFGETTVQPEVIKETVEPETIVTEVIPHTTRDSQPTASSDLTSPVATEKYTPILSTDKPVSNEVESEIPVETEQYSKPVTTVTEAPEATKPNDTSKATTPSQISDEILTPEEEAGQFPPSGSTGYGQEPDYGEEDQAFGPGTCRYGGKVYVSAQQIPRDDPCDFCFCFRSDIICLQQSCPPPIHGCHEEPIQGFCCPRYECPVSMATTLNVTTTTTTTTTTLPPHFLPHAYKGAAQRKGCQIKGHTYKVGDVVRASSGPCLHCTCGGDGQMKCDPKACTPEPMLRQMIAAAVSAKRRR